MSEPTITLEEQINADLKQAMRAKDESAKLALRSVKSSLANSAKAGDTAQSITDEDVLAIIQREAKRRREAAAEYEKVGSPENAATELAELTVLERYLPQQMSEEELTALVQEVITETGATSMRDMGRVMSAVIERAQGRADGKQANQIVRGLLS